MFQWGTFISTVISVTIVGEFSLPISMNKLYTLNINAFQQGNVDYAGTVIGIFSTSTTTVKYSTGSMSSGGYLYTAPSLNKACNFCLIGTN